MNLIKNFSKNSFFTQSAVKPSVVFSSEVFAGDCHGAHAPRNDLLSVFRTALFYPLLFLIFLCTFIFIPSTARMAHSETVCLKPEDIKAREFLLKAKLNASTCGSGEEKMELKREKNGMFIFTPLEKPPLLSDPKYPNSKSSESLPAEEHSREKYGR